MQPTVSDDDDRFSQDSAWTEDPLPTHVVDILSHREYESLEKFLNAYKTNNNFDWLMLLKSNCSTYHQVLQAINYCRVTAQQCNSGNRSSEDTLKVIRSGIEERKFEDERFYRPVLEQDTLLLSLPDLIFPEDSDHESESGAIENERRILDQMAQGELCNKGAVQKDMSVQLQEKQADESYFRSYDFLEIHREMLSDEVRNGAYRESLQGAVRGKVVLDIGCGTGILSLYALKFGARSVIAVDNSRIIYTALSIFQRNSELFPELQIASKLWVVKGKAEDFLEGNFDKVNLLRRPTVALEAEPGLDVFHHIERGTFSVDVLVSEWMGYGLFFESMLDTVLTARDLCLKAGGAMIPTRCSLFVQLASLKQHRRFTNLDSFDFSTMLAFNRTAQVLEVAQEDIMSARLLINSFCLESCTKEELMFESSWLSVPIVGSDPITALVLTFDCLMDQSNAGSVLSTAVGEKTTHWYHTVLPLSPSEWIKDAKDIELKVTYAKHPGASRNLNIKVEYGVDGGPRKTICYDLS